MQTRDDNAAREKVWELIKDIKIALMVTQSDKGMQARPMAAMKREGETLWFMTRADSGKVAEIQQQPEVLLAYSEPEKQNYVSIHGVASVEQDRAKIKDLWSEAARVWFPQGPDDPTITLLRVEATAAEYWDSPSSAFVYAYGYLKARLTGEPPKHMGDMAHVKMAKS